MFAVGVDLGRHPRPRAARAGGARRARRHAPRSSLTSSDGARGRARPSSATLLDHHLYRVPRPRRARDLGRRRTTALYDELRRARGGAPGARHARLADAACRRAALRQVPEGRAPAADGLAREGDDRRGAHEMGRRRPQAARHATSRSRTCSSRRSTARRSTSSTRTACFTRGATRGDGVQGEDVTVNLRTIERGAAADARRRRRRRSLEVRGEVYLPLSGFPRAERAPRRRRARSSRRTRATRPPARCGRRTPPITADAAARDLGLRHGRARRARASRRSPERSQWLRERGFRTNPFVERLESIEEVAAALRASGSSGASSSTTRSTAS